MALGEGRRAKAFSEGRRPWRGRRAKGGARARARARGLARAKSALEGEGHTRGRGAHARAPTSKGWISKNVAVHGE